MTAAMNLPLAYHPYGAAEQLLYDRSPQILMSGPAGTGKSRAILEKLYLCALKWPRSRCLIVRKTRVSLTQTGLVTFEQKVLPEGSRVKRNTITDSYVLPNGSVIACGGMDNYLRIMSTEYDLIAVLESTELEENDWEALTTRLRNNVMPFQQIIGDCNPGPPTHWLKKRADRGVTVMLESRHEDNPSVTAAYLATLDALTGVRKERLRYGIWAAADGLVYDAWDNARHLIDRIEIPSSWRRLRAIDFGYTNPFSCQWWAIDPDGRMYLYREIYQTQRLVEDHAQDIKRLSLGERYEVTVADHDAEDRATLERHGIVTEAAHKAVSEGIQAVQERLKPAGDGKARLFILRDSLVERDLTLESKPASVVEELPGYVWAKATRGALKEVPEKKDDHGADTLRYAVAWVDKLGNDAPPQTATGTRAAMQAALNASQRR
jgi:PBSX family phage terminase large subunit